MKTISQDERARNQTTRRRSRSKFSSAKIRFYRESEGKKKITTEARESTDRLSSHVDWTKRRWNVTLISTRIHQVALLAAHSCSRTTQARPRPTLTDFRLVYTPTSVPLINITGKQLWKIGARQRQSQIFPSGMAVEKAREREERER